MESVFKSVGGLDDAYAVTQVAGALFRRYGRGPDGVEAQRSSSPGTYDLSEGRVAAQAAIDAAGAVMDSPCSLCAKLGTADGLSVPCVRTDASRFPLRADRDLLVAGTANNVAQNFAGVVDQTTRQVSQASLDAAIGQASVRHDALASAAQGLNYNNGISLGQVGALTGLEASSWESFSYFTRATTFSSMRQLRRGSSVTLSD